MTASFRLLCSKYPWAREILVSYNSFTETEENDHIFSKLHVNDLVAQTIRLLKEQKVKEELMSRNVEPSLSFLEELIYSVNESHVSSEKMRPYFDEEIFPLIEKYAEILVYHASSTGTETESMKRFQTFLIGLPTHPALGINSAKRTEAIVMKLLAKQLSEEKSEESAMNFLEEPSKQFMLENRDQRQVASNKTVECCGNDKKDEKKSEQFDANGSKEVITHAEDGELSVIPESPLKSPQATCVGSATIRGIIPFSSELFFALTPPQAQSSVIEITSDSAVETSPLKFPAPTSNQTPSNLTELQKSLRQRFHTPGVVTPTEKLNHRTVLRTIRSHRRRAQSPWKIVQFKSPLQAKDLPKQLFVENDKINQSTPASSFTLCLSPDTGNDTFSPSSSELFSKPLQEKDSSQVKSPQTIGSPIILQENMLSQVNFSKVIGSPTSDRHSPLLGRDGTRVNLLVELGKNGNTYSELKRSIEGNLMGCEASLSDVELMDEIESSLNLVGENDDGSFLAEPVVYGDSKAEILPVTLDSSSPKVVKSSSKVHDSPNSPMKKTRVRASQEQMERRRSSRLAGIPSLPLKYTLEPLPDCRRTSSKKSSQKRSASPERKENNPSLSSPKKHQSDSISVLPTPQSCIEPPVTQVTWQEVRLLLPPCWANILERHVKTHHPDEMLSIQDIPGGRCPTVYCYCSKNESRQSL